MTHKLICVMLMLVLSLTTGCAPNNNILVNISSEESSEVVEIEVSKAVEERLHSTYELEIISFLTALKTSDNVNGDVAAYKDDRGGIASIVSFEGLILQHPAKNIIGSNLSNVISIDLKILKQTKEESFIKYQYNFNDKAKKIIFMAVDRSIVMVVFEEDLKDILMD